MSFGQIPKRYVLLGNDTENTSDAVACTKVLFDGKGVTKNNKIHRVIFIFLN
jgi:hypothetical protein